MNTIIRFLTVGFTCVLCMGCTSTKAYLTDRGRDAADMITITWGQSLGAKARVGPLHAGFYSGADHGGLRGGEFHPLFKPDYNGPDCSILDLDLTFIGGEIFQATNMPYAKERGKFCGAGGYILLIEQTQPGWRQKIPYYTNVEVAGGLIAGARLGINLSEIADFLLGWTTIDFLSDDLEWKSINQGEQAGPGYPPQGVGSPDP